ncbi:AMIN domain-containing protein, partial [bacterium]|nr:AMIN domain-containing protein [bacterium]
MMLKFIKIFIIFILIGFQNVFADVLKINDITFDSSDSIIFIATNSSGNDIQIKKGFLSNPNRIFLDIDNAVLTKKQSSFDFKNGKLTNLKISQFSTSPNTVRIVMTYTNKLQPENIQVMSLGGNIIIKLEKYKPSQDYLTPIYREVKSSAYDYFEKVQVTESETLSKTEDSIILAPAEPGKSLSSSMVTLQNEPVRINPPIKESKLRSRYFLSNAFVKQQSLLLAGTGIVNLEKVFYLSNPSRVVFDIPNAVSTARIRTQSFKLSENETAKIGQFEPTKIRVVITSPDADKYKAVYSSDLQNILIVREDRMKGIKLYANTSKMLSANVKTKNEYRNTIDTLSLDFSEPIVHSLKRTNNEIEIDLYNITQDNLLLNTKKIKTGNLKN